MSAEIIQLTKRSEATNQPREAVATAAEVIQIHTASSKTDVPAVGGIEDLEVGRDYFTMGYEPIQFAQLCPSPLTDAIRDQWTQQGWAVTRR